LSLAVGHVADNQRKDKKGRGGGEGEGRGGEERGLLAAFLESSYSFSRGKKMLLQAILLPIITGSREKKKGGKEKGKRSKRTHNEGAI